MHTEYQDEWYVKSCNFWQSGVSFWFKHHIFYKIEKLLILNYMPETSRTHVHSKTKEKEAVKQIIEDGNELHDINFEESVVGTELPHMPKENSPNTDMKVVDDSAQTE